MKSDCLGYRLTFEKRHLCARDGGRIGDVVRDAMIHVAGLVNACSLHNLYTDADEHGSTRFRHGLDMPPWSALEHRFRNRLDSYMLLPRYQVLACRLAT